MTKQNEYTTNAAEAAADEALIAFLDAEPAHAELGDWMRRYPASSADFACAAAARWAGAPLGLAPVAYSLPASEIARTRALAAEALRAFRVARTPTVVTTVAATRAPLTGLVAAAKERGFSPTALAETIRVPYALLFKLHRRLIAPDSVPISCLNALSDALDRTREEIIGYLRQPPTLALGASYRADAAPQAGPQEGFADALAADPETTAAHRDFHAA